MASTVEGRVATISWFAGTTSLFLGLGSMYAADFWFKPHSAESTFFGYTSLGLLALAAPCAIIGLGATLMERRKINKSIDNGTYKFPTPLQDY